MTPHTGAATQVDTSTTLIPSRAIVMAATFLEVCLQVIRDANRAASAKASRCAGGS
jgi:hypothetical protein